ncbi:gfo/Idh/MocA family oxidoreductase [Verminephrobacter aporrectodeae subsp. tuberculatae]|nr:gfo/Idh/MocA family oxidoreductase [Verminephrobacter aporrectodeae subsp. tuberculatae]
MHKRIRVGFIGCGEVTQLLHLPTLRELPDLFEVTAFHDVSAKALNGTATAWPEASRHCALESLVADEQVDAVVIANPDAWHADTALMAMRGGKHVLIENPSASRATRQRHYSRLKGNATSSCKWATCADTHRRLSRPYRLCAIAASRSRWRVCATSSDPTRRMLTALRGSLRGPTILQKMFVTRVFGSLLAPINPK